VGVDDARDAAAGDGVAALARGAAVGHARVGDAALVGAAPVDAAKSRAVAVLRGDAAVSHARRPSSLPAQSLSLVQRGGGTSAAGVSIVGASAVASTLGASIVASREGASRATPVSVPPTTDWFSAQAASDSRATRRTACFMRVIGACFARSCQARPSGSRAAWNPLARRVVGAS
jgi:hypothetical protein